MRIFNGFFSSFLSRPAHFIIPPLVSLLFILSAALALRLHGFSERSLGTDESITLFLAAGHGMDARSFTGKASAGGGFHCRAKDLKRFFRADRAVSFGGYTGSLARLDPHPPLYLWVVFFVMRVFSGGLAAVRAFSLLMGLLSVYLAYLLAKELFDERAGIFAALFVSVSALAVRYSQEARSYSLVLALGLLAWLFLARFEKRGRPPDALFFAVFNCLGIYAHYFFGFISCGFFLYFTLIHRKNSRLLDGFYAAFLLSLLGLLPWVSVMLGRGYRFDLVEWIFAYPGISDKISALFSGMGRFFFIFPPSCVLLQAAGSLLFAVLMFYSGTSLRKEYPRQLFLCVCVLSVPLLGMLALDLLQGGLLLRQERFWNFSLAGVIPLAGYSLGRLFDARRQLVYLIAVLMLLSSLWIGGRQVGPAPRRISGWINGESGGKTAAVIVYNFRTVTMPQAFYLDDDILLFPVLNAEQFSEAVNAAADRADKVFVVRHLHHADPALMDEPFMRAEAEDPRLRLKTRLFRDNIDAAEYVKGAY